MIIFYKFVNLKKNHQVLFDEESSYATCSNGFQTSFNQINLAGPAPFRDSKQTPAPLILIDQTSARSPDRQPKQIPMPLTMIENLDSHPNEQIVDGLENVTNSLDSSTAANFNFSKSSSPSSHVFYSTLVNFFFTYR